MRTKRAVRGITLIETATASTIAAVAVGTAQPALNRTHNPPPRPRTPPPNAPPQQ